MFLYCSIPLNSFTTKKAFIFWKLFIVAGRRILAGVRACGGGFRLGVDGEIRETSYVILL